jgi:uncharacterized protein YcbK (DUF882 family)
MDSVDAGLVTALEKIRAHFDAPITITSGCRCEAYNRQVGGAADSQHKKSRAADIKVKGVDPSAVYEWVDGWHTGGAGRYRTFTHIDSRNNPARW